MEMAHPYEPNVLKNEFPVYRDTLESLFENHPVYVFGYGSLLYREGWLSRGMRKPPRKNDLIECELNGYKRGPYGIYDRIAFYGVIEDPIAITNGVLAPIKSAIDWVSLMRTEFVAGIATYATYRVVDVTKSIVGDNIPPGKIHCVVNRAENKSVIKRQLWRIVWPAGKYYEKVYAGVLKYRSDAFVERFLETGGVKGEFDL